MPYHSPGGQFHEFDDKKLPNDGKKTLHPRSRSRSRQSQVDGGKGEESFIFKNLGASVRGVSIPRTGLGFEAG